MVQIQNLLPIFSNIINICYSKTLTIVNANEQAACLTHAQFFLLEKEHNWSPL